MQYIMQPQAINFELCTLIKFHSRPFSKSLNLWEEFMNVVGLIYTIESEEAWVYSWFGATNCFACMWFAMMLRSVMLHPSCDRGLLDFVICTAYQISRFGSKKAAKRRVPFQKGAKNYFEKKYFRAGCTSISTKKEDEESGDDEIRLQFALHCFRTNIKNTFDASLFRDGFNNSSRQQDFLHWLLGNEKRTRICFPSAYFWAVSISLMLWG